MLPIPDTTVWSSSWRLISECLRRNTVTTPSRRSEERRVGKECRSLCDWSSDVCSSDLLVGVDVADTRHHGLVEQLAFDLGVLAPQHRDDAVEEIGRASCRERV